MMALEDIAADEARCVLGLDDGPPVAVVPLPEDRGPAVAALFSRAFQDDPPLVHACPDPEERARWLPWLFRWSTWRGLLLRQTLHTAGPLVGVAVTTGPERCEITAEELARFGYGRGREAVGADVWDRVMAASAATFDAVDAALHRAIAEPHWYLGAIAVEPTQQRQGIGSRLLQAVAARADADALPVVLLTYQPKNLSLYQRHGYTVVCEGTAGGSDLPWWGMRRDPDRSRSVIEVSPLKTGHAKVRQQMRAQPRVRNA